MQGIQAQVYNRVHDLRIKYNVRIEEVYLSRLAWHVLRAELAQDFTAFVGQTGPRQAVRDPQGIVYKLIPDMIGGWGILLDGNNRVIDALELELPADVVATPPRPTPWKAIPPSKDDPAAATVSNITVAKTLTAKGLQDAMDQVFGRSMQQDLKEAQDRLSRRHYVTAMAATMGVTEYQACRKLGWDPDEFGLHPGPEEQGPGELDLPTRTSSTGLEAYRLWLLERTGWTPLAAHYALKSITANVVWDGPILRADAPPANDKPGYRYTGPGHGIYAMREPEDPYVEARSRAILVAGKVELRGKVVVHLRGYRAEHARILELRVPRLEKVVMREAPSRQERDAFFEMVHRLEELYHCDVKEGPWT